MEPDPCLSCPLPDCDEQDSGCFFFKPQQAASRRYYLKLREDPVRYAEYLRKKVMVDKRYQTSEKGHTTANAQTKRWRAANLKRAKEISHRYHEKHKTERLVAAREYKRNRKARNGDEGADNRTHLQSKGL